MATTDYTAQFDEKILDFIKPYLPSTYNICDEMVRDGMYQRDRLVELALALTSNGQYEMDSTYNWDFSDESDAKSCTTNYRQSQGPDGMISIKGVKNKKTLRVINFDPKRDTFRFFVIWEWKETLNTVEFSANPTAWSKYIDGTCGKELDSFEELAQFNFTTGLVESQKTNDRDKALNYTLTFGMHEGKTIEQLLNNNIQYLRWMVREMYPKQLQGSWKRLPDYVWNFLNYSI